MVKRLLVGADFLTGKVTIVEQDFISANVACVNTCHESDGIVDSEDKLTETTSAASQSTFRASKDRNELLR